MSDKTLSLEQAVEAARSDLLVYSRLCDPTFKSSNTGFQYKLTRRLMQLARREIIRQIINTPPQHGKSRMCAQEFPAWLLGIDPTLKIVLTSYSQDLVEDSSRFVRDRFLNPAHRLIFPDSVIRRDTDSRKFWSTTAGGYFKAVSVEGQITGKGADVAIIDDPIKGFAEAKSETIRKRVWDWYLGTLMTRLAPNAIILVIMTRWHPDDLTGRLLDPEILNHLNLSHADREQWDLISLPVFAEKDDWLGRKEGMVLYPERYSQEEMLARKAFYDTTSEGRHTWAAMFEQRPTVRGGNYIPVQNFRVREEREIPKGITWKRAWDLAATEKKTSDYTAGVMGAIDQDGNLWLRDMVRGQWEWPKARERIAQLALNDGVEVGVEAVAGFKTAYQNLREVLPPTVLCREHEAEKDKLTRALEWIALVENKKVFLVRGQWVGDFLNEAEGFPGGAHDDQIDAVSLVYKMLKQTGGHYTVPKRETSRPRIERPGRGRILI